MDEIGDIIRKVLFFRKLSITDFAKSIGLSSKAVENVIYQNIKKKDVIEKISKGLGVNLFDYIENSKPELIQNTSQIDTIIYKKASAIVLENIDRKGIFCTKEQIESLIAILYEYMVANKSLSDDIANVFCEGMITYAIKNFMVTNKNLSF